MKESTRIRYINKLERKSEFGLITEYTELNHIYLEAIRIFLLNPNPPYKEEDKKFIQHIEEKKQLVIEILDKRKEANNGR